MGQDKTGHVSNSVLSQPSAHIYINNLGVMPTGPIKETALLLKEIELL